MNYSYQVSKWNKGNRRSVPTDISGEITGPDALGMATRLAEHWAANPATKSVNLLRADLRGINAGKHFLYRIVKAS